MNFSSANKDVSAVSELPNENYSETLQFGMWVLIIGFGGFLSWAMLAPLDEGVPAPGVIASESKRKKVDHPNGGVIKQILVQEGSKVKAGEELLLFDDVQALSALNTTLDQWRTAVATAARLDAERKGLEELVFPSELIAVKREKDVETLMVAQTDLFRSRRTALQGELALIREMVRGLELQVKSLDQLKAGRAMQVELLEERLAAYSTLKAKGVASRNQMIEIESQLAEVRSKESDDLTKIVELKTRLAELRMRLSLREIDFRAEVETKLFEVQREIYSLKERLFSLRDIHKHLSIKSPVNGVVVDLAFHTIGSSIKPGDRILDIVPQGDRLIVEAQVAPQHIDRIYPGLPAHIHFDAYMARAERHVITGIVEVVSADALIDSRTEESYYAIRVSVPPVELEKLGKLGLQPGMTSTVMVKTGERSLFVYLMRPFLRFFSSAMKEY